MFLTLLIPDQPFRPLNNILPAINKVKIPKQMKDLLVLKVSHLYACLVECYVGVAFLMLTMWGKMVVVRLNSRDIQLQMFLHC